METRHIWDQMTRWSERKLRHISKMNPNKKIKFNDWHKKKDPSIWKNADSECTNKPVGDSQ